MCTGVIEKRVGGNINISTQSLVKRSVRSLRLRPNERNFWSCVCVSAAFRFIERSRLIHTAMQNELSADSHAQTQHQFHDRNYATDNSKIYSDRIVFAGVRGVRKASVRYRLCERYNYARLADRFSAGQNL